MIGVGAIAALGAYLGAAIVGIPIVMAGLLMLLLSRSMARRTWLASFLVLATGCDRP